jgi:hypothetical protein
VQTRILPLRSLEAVAAHVLSGGDSVCNKAARELHSFLRFDARSFQPVR